MSHKIKIYIISMGLFLLGAMQLSVAAPNVLAAPPARGGPATAPECSDNSNAGIATCLKNNKIVEDLNLIVNFLSAAVGIAIVGSIIFGGIQYSMASGNANSTQAARQRLTNAFIALFAFIFVFAFLQWLIPGGL